MRFACSWSPRIDPGQRKLTEKNDCVRCRRECVRYSRLAKVGANRASDNQWDCGGALARLRHGTNKAPLFVEFLVAEQTNAGWHGP